MTDFNVTTGRNWKFTLNYYSDQAETTPVNLTGYSVQLGVSDSTGTAVPDGNDPPDFDNAGNLYATITNPSGGVITVNVPAATTASWAVGNYLYDLALTSPTTDVETILQGTLRIKAGIAQ